MHKTGIALRLISLSLALGICFSSVFAQTTHQHLQIKQLATGVWAIVGPLTNRTPENLGNNATFGLIESKEGLVLIDPGGSRKGAQALHQVIKTLSDKPIRFVINTGGQDHRWFGNQYFHEQGAIIIASKAAVADQKARFSLQYNRLDSLITPRQLAGTEAYHGEITFDDSYVLKIGERQLEIYHQGAAHTPGDSYVWLGDDQILFTGDIVYVERMLGIGSMSNSASWVRVFESMAKHKPKVIVPGHGSPTTLKQAKSDTLDYLKTLRQRVKAFIDEGGDMSEISKVDQSEFKRLKNFDDLKGRNAQRVFEEIEFE